MWSSWFGGWSYLIHLFMERNFEKAVQQEATCSAWQLVSFSDDNLGTKTPFVKPY